jgi:biotin synthase
MSKIPVSDIKTAPLSELISEALRLKLAHRGLSFGLCTISNARSGRCSEDCAFCAQSSWHRTRAEAYPLKDIDVLVEEAEAAKESGASRFSIVTSGKGPKGAEIDALCRRISAIRSRVGIDVCCSVGIVDRAGLEAMKEAGLSRLHHNIETSERFFPSICTTHSFGERLATIEAAKEAGLEVCAGGIIGLGEDMDDRISMAKRLKELDVDSMPLNILVPIEGTPLADRPLLRPAEIIRTISAWRIIHPRAALRIAGGRETVLRQFETLAFFAGADAMLIGGYLTVRGRDVATDIAMVEEVRELWKAESVR